MSLGMTSIFAFQSLDSKKADRTVEFMVELMPKKWPKQKCKKYANQNAKNMQKMPKKIQAWNPGN